MNRAQMKAAEIVLIEHVKQFPLETYKSLGKRFGLTYPQVVYILKKANLLHRSNAWVDPSGEGEWVFIKKGAGN